MTDFSNVKRLLDLRISGKLEEKFYILPIDCGLGKTNFIKDRISYFKDTGFSEENSIFVCVKTKKEIEDIICGSGLEEADYACLTADETINAFGLGAERSHRAPVLFTTHAMLRNRLFKKSFGKAEEFFYRGQPRVVRFWDEQFGRSEPIHIGRDDILKLLSPLRSKFPAWAEAVEDFSLRIKEATDGTILTVPGKFGDGPQYAYVEGRGPFLPEDVANIARTLKAAQGRRLRVSSSKMYGHVLVGAGPRLPADLAPMFIFDASARVSDLTALAAKNDPMIELLPAITRDYGPLEINLWKHACGRTALADPDKLTPIVRAIAKVVDAHDRETLVIGYKAREGLDIATAIRAAVEEPAKVLYEHYGRHSGTNAYRDVRQQVVIGSFQQRDTVYLAAYIAATGVDVAEIKGSEWTEISKGEARSNLLQAICRGNIRNDVGGGRAGDCKVYLIMPANSDPKSLILETFPGCTLNDWAPDKTVLKGKIKEVFEAIAGRIDRGDHMGTIAKVDIRKEVGLSSPRLSQIIGDDRFNEALARIGVTIQHFAFKVEPIRLGPYYIRRIIADWYRRKPHLLDPSNTLA